jgi:hypothetical protein
MSTETIPIGRPHVMITNQEYAVPAISLLINVQSLGAGAIETSNDKIIWTAVSIDNDENFECSATWIRCTTAADACIISAKYSLIDVNPVVIESYEVELTEAEVEALDVTPKLIVPALAGFTHVLIRLIIQWEITVVYTSSPIMQLRYVGGSGAFADLLDGAGAVFAGTSVAKRANMTTPITSIHSSASATVVLPTGRGLELYMQSALTGAGTVTGFRATALISTIPGI